MLRAITVKNLRGLRSAEITDLTRLVVLVGPNGSGKTSVLDAIEIGASPTPGHAVGRSITRRKTTAPGFRWLIWQGSADHPAEIRVFSDEISWRRTVIRRQESVSAYELSVFEETDSSSDVVVDGKVVFDPENGHFQSSVGSVAILDIPSLRLVDLVASFRTPLHQLYTTAVEQGRRDEAMAIVRSLLEDVSGSPLRRSWRPASAASR